MSQALWAAQPRPTTGADACMVGHWQPATLADLTAHRRELARWTTAVARLAPTNRR